MLLSKKLLFNFFPFLKDITDDTLEKSLLSIGCEVENIFYFEKINNLIVGEIIDISKHPKSVKLNLCKVNIGKEIKQIICGANNVKVGAKVIVALKNANLPNNLTINDKKIMDVKSEGMICSYSELTLRHDFLSDEDKNTIINLDTNAIIGDSNPLKYINLDDVIFDISIPSNRNELNGIFPIGFDLLGVLKPEIEIDELSLSFEPNFSESILNYFKKIKKNQISINNQAELDFFATLKIENVIVKESTWIIKSFLMNSGIKPVNFIVDITNFVMLLTSNPIHAYDGSTIKDEITVKKVKNEIKVECLDDKEYLIPKNSYISCVDNEIIAISGIIGTKKSSITQKTTTVIFEIANFNYSNIANTVNKINLKTPSSILFSKKIPLWVTIKAFQILIDFLNNKKCTFLGISFIDFFVQKKKIKFEHKRIVELLGMELSKEIIIDYLKQLKFHFIDEHICPPIYRDDINNIHDIVEEILKIIKLDNIVSIPIQHTLVDTTINNNEYNNFLKIQNYFIHKGFSLLKTYNLTSSEINQKFNIFKSKKNYEIINPISKDKKIIRSSVIGQLLNVFSHNNAYKNQLIPIFEIQKLSYDNTSFYHLSLLLDNKMFINNINKTFLPIDIFYLKSLIVDFYNYFDRKIKFDYLSDDDCQILIKNNSLKIINNNKIVGYLGQINPNILEDYKISNYKLFFIEINVNELISYNEKKLFTLNYNSINNQHKIIRNLSIILENKPFNLLLDAILRCADIDEHLVKDVFKISDNIYSYNIEFSINKNFKNISQEEINKIFNRIIEYFIKESFKIKGVS